MRRCSVSSSSRRPAAPWPTVTTPASYPALDGGYTLIALARPTPTAFAIDPAAWGGPDVHQLTLEALQRAGLDAAVLAPVTDLDTAADALALLADPCCPPGVRAALKPDPAVAA